MKILAYILSFYVLALTFAPCVDGQDDNSIPKTEISQNPHKVPLDDQDHCSPFCTCLCCQSVFQMPDKITLNPSVELLLGYSDCPIYFENPDLFDFLVPPKA